MYHFTFLSEDGLRDKERTYRPVNIISWDREGQKDIPFHVSHLRMDRGTEGQKTKDTPL